MLRVPRKFDEVLSKEIASFFFQREKFKEAEGIP